MSGDTRGDPVRRPRKLQRARVGPGPLRELKDLLYQAYLAAGSPSLGEIETAIKKRDGLRGAPSRDTVRRCISSPNLPPSQADVVAIAVVLGRGAAWDESDLATRVRRLWIEAGMVEPAGKPLAEFSDPFALEVHRAIDIGSAAQDTELSVLPAYVERDHDSRLREIVGEAECGASRLVMLVGGSSTGKTRACWEAVRTLSDRWRLWHPFDPTRPDAALAELEHIAPYTVVWLNEAQHYVLAPTGLGENVAAGLRTLLNDSDRGPVLILGTIWSEYWNDLTTLHHASTDKDPYAQARALLTGHDLPIPWAFTDADLQRLAGKARHDPRLAHAAERAEQGQITQYLAGAPALMERYDTAPPAARALIEAAMDARRLGHGLALPQALLEAAAGGYLTDTQWDLLDDGWLGQALTYTTAPLRGARGAVSRIRPRPGPGPGPGPGQTEPAQPHYRLADYLEQHGRNSRGTVPAPAALWDAFIHHATHTDRAALAQEAQSRGLLRVAFHLYRAAAEAGDADAVRQTADLLRGADRVDEAMAWYERACEAGDSDALGEAARMLEWAGRVDEAITWYQRGSEAGDATALDQAVRLLERAGRGEEAITWLQTLAEAGNTDALVQAARLLKQAGRGEEAITWLLTLAETGHNVALVQASWLLEGAGRVDEAIALYQRAADADEAFDASNAVWLLEETGRIEEAIAWCRRAAAADNNSIPLWPITRLLEQVGRIGEAIAWCRRAAAAGNSDAFEQAVRLLEKAGRGEEAIAWLQTFAEAGHTGALRQAVRLLEEAGRSTEAITWCRHAAEAGNTDALMQGARLLGKAGRVDEAFAWYERAADAGQLSAYWDGARLLEGAGRVDEAFVWYQRANGNRYVSVLWDAVQLLEKADRVEEAIVWLRTLGEAGDSDALEQAARLLAETGRREKAITWLQPLAESGRDGALRQAVRLLVEAGRVEEAITWYRRAAEAGNADALTQAARLLEKTGRIEEAITWYRRAAETGIAHALEQAARLLAEAGRLEEAITWYRRAGEAGNANALWHVTQLLEKAGRPEEGKKLRRYGWEPHRAIAQPWEATPPPAWVGSVRHAS
ncbi:tetratricopeptide repeat protein [Streptomyces bobili]|uniref:tetratricopeptide repeat protein n=1 Tax=Streptomyces bobili TaxID=67280 RepID=UPI003789F8A6